MERIMETLPTEKSLFTSKTLWVNLIVGIAAFFPAVAEKVNPVTVMQAMTFINIILRFVTKDKVVLS